MGHRRIGRAYAKCIFAIRTDSEERGVAVRAHLEAALPGMLLAHPGEVVAHLKEIAVCGHHGTGGAVERLVEIVAELEGGIGVVGRRKGWRGTREADGEFP